MAERCRGGGVKGGHRASCLFAMQRRSRSPAHASTEADLSGKGGWNYSKKVAVYSRSRPFSLRPCFPQRRLCVARISRQRENTSLTAALAERGRVGTARAR